MFVKATEKWRGLPVTLLYNITVPDIIPMDSGAFHSSLELLAFFSIFSWKTDFFFLDIASFFGSE